MSAARTQLIATICARRKRDGCDRERAQLRNLFAQVRHSGRHSKERERGELSIVNKSVNYSERTYWLSLSFESLLSQVALAEIINHRFGSEIIIASIGSIVRSCECVRPPQ